MYNNLLGITYGSTNTRGQADGSRKIEGLIKDDKSEVADIMISSRITTRMAYYKGINRMKTIGRQVALTRLVRGLILNYNEIITYSIEKTIFIPLINIYMKI